MPLRTKLWIIAGFVVPFLLFVIIWNLRAQSSTFGPSTNVSPVAGAACQPPREAILDNNGRIWTCDANISPPVWMPSVPLSGTTPSMGGSLLALGACTSTTVAVTGAQVGWPVEISASDGTNIPGLGVSLSGTVTSSGTVTASECAIVALTPAAKTFNVAVLHP